MKRIILNTLLKLDAMIKKYEDQFAKAPHKTLLQAMQHLRTYAVTLVLEQNSVEDVFAEGEPNAAQLAKLIEYAKRKPYYYYLCRRNG